MYYNGLYQIYFTVSDTEPKNQPKTLDEFIQRCDEVKKWLPARGNNIIFAEKIFELFRDCGLITKANIDFLSNKILCDRYFSSTMNPLGGVLRKSGLPMKTGVTCRYYCSKNKGRAVICQGEVYYISSQWYASNTGNPNKKDFYDWVVEKACENLLNIIEN